MDYNVDQLHGSRGVARISQRWEGGEEGHTVSHPGKLNSPLQRS